MLESRPGPYRMAGIITRGNTWVRKPHLLISTQRDEHPSLNTLPSLWTLLRRSVCTLLTPDNSKPGISPWPSVMSPRRKDHNKAWEDHEMIVRLPRILYFDTINKCAVKARVTVWYTINTTPSAIPRRCMTEQIQNSTHPHHIQCSVLPPVHARPKPSCTASTLSLGSCSVQWQGSVS